MNKKTINSLVINENKESVDLMRRIGMVYFVIFFETMLIVVSLYEELLVLTLNRLLICYSWAFLGIGIRSFFYYGILKEKELKKLSKKGTEDCVFSYIFYGIVSTVLSSFIYLTFYENFKNMSSSLFLLISVFLFTYFGFSIENALRFLRK